MNSVKIESTNSKKIMPNNKLVTHLEKINSNYFDERRPGKYYPKTHFIINQKI